MTAANDAGAATNWRPEILDEQHETDRIRLAELRSDPRIDTLDTVPSALAELAKVLPPAGPELLGEPPRWIHYPWRRTVVATLGPRSYRRLRLDRNRNKITDTEQAVQGQRRIGVIGQSVGHAVAHTLAMEGLAGQLRLADFDLLELSNLNRVPATILDIGVNKAVVCARRIAEIDPYLDIDIFSGGLTSEVMDQFLDGLDLVIEECDSLDIKVAVREAARERRIPVVMETSDRGLIDIERFDLEPERPIFHGMLGELRSAELQGLSTHDKVPHVLRILDPAELSATMAASMAEVDETLTTWPQLAEDVTLGAATVAAVVRRTGRGESRTSGRGRIDLQASLDRIAQPPLPVEDDAPAAPLVIDAPPQDDPLLHIVHAANLAPSGGNIQPWEFVAEEGRLEFHLVPERSTAMDVAFRGSYVAIGASLCNARIAAAAGGRLGKVELFPSDSIDHVATLQLAGDTDPELAAERDAMLQRCANRQHGRPQALPDSLVEELHTVVAAEGGTLHLLTDATVIAECGELLGESDRLRYLTPTLHAEMMSELRWPGRDRLDIGLDVRTLELDSADLAKLAVARRADVMQRLAQWDGGRSLGQPTRDSLGSSSAVAVVTVRGGTPADYVRGGAAVQRLWIRAQARGLGVQPVSPVFLFAQDEADIDTLVGTPYRAELAQLAQQFRSLSAVPVDEEFALILRLSHAPRPTARSQRMSLDAVLRRPAGSGTEADG